MGYFLGVDIGTTYTAAATWRDGRVEVAGLGSPAPMIPTVVAVVEDGTLLVGEPAERRGRSEPERLAREFKRRLGDQVPMVVGGSSWSADTLMARVLRTVVDQVAEREGGPPDGIVVTCPANWGTYKRDLLEQAIRAAGIDGVQLASEPEAAAVHYASQERVEVGSVVAVYDLGGGTFDAAVLRKAATGWELLGRPEGIERLGGIDFDEAVFRHVLASLGSAELDSEDEADLVAVARLRQDCVEAKEALSADAHATIPVYLPSGHRQVRLTRAEFGQMIRPALAGSIAALERALRGAEVAAAEVSAVILVGGSSRIPLVGRLVGAALGRPVALDAHPKFATPLGAALLAATAAGATDTGAPGPTTTGSDEPGPVTADGGGAGPTTAGQEAESPAPRIIPAGLTTPDQGTESDGATTPDDPTTPDRRTESDGTTTPAGPTTPDQGTEATGATTPDDPTTPDQGTESNGATTSPGPTVPTPPVPAGGDDRVPAAADGQADDGDSDGADSVVDGEPPARPGWRRPGWATAAAVVAVVALVAAGAWLRDSLASEESAPPTTGGPSTTGAPADPRVEEVATLAGPGAEVSGVAFSPDGTLVATAGADGTLQVWDADSHEELASVTAHAGEVTQVAFSPDGTLVATAGADGTVRLADAQGDQVATLTGHTDAVEDMAFSSDGTLLATASPDDTARLWGTADHREVATLEGHTDDVREVAFSPDGSLVATGSWDGTVRLWDTQGGPVATLEGHTDRVREVVFAPDGATVASAGADGTARLWDAERYDEVATLEGHTENVSDVAFSPDGDLVATSSADGTVRLWDAEAHDEVALLADGADDVFEVVFSPVGALLAADDDGPAATLWDTRSEEAVATLTTGSVFGLAFSPDGGRFVASGEGGTARLSAITAG